MRGTRFVILIVVFGVSLGTALRLWEAAHQDIVIATNESGASRPALDKDSAIEFEQPDAARAEVALAADPCEPQPKAVEPVEPAAHLEKKRIVNKQELYQWACDVRDPWTNAQTVSGRMILELGVPIDPDRFRAAVAAVGPERDVGAAFDIILRNYGPRELWSVATTPAQHAAIVQLELDDNALSELMDMPLSVVTAWREELSCRSGACFIKE